MREIITVATIKYLLLLIVMFAFGLLLLGVFNPEMEVEGEEGISASVYKSWDTYTDTSTWVNWKTEDHNVEWLEGRPGAIGAKYRIYNESGLSYTESISELYRDSLLVVDAEYKDGIERRSNIGFKIENGKTIVKETQVWKSPGFFQNIELNFNQSSIAKKLENELKALKTQIEGPIEDK